MNKAVKLAEERARNEEMARRLIKQFLYALHECEGFGARRLTRVLVKWSETYKFVKDPTNNENDVMLMIDSVLDSVMPQRVLSAVGYEKLLDRKGSKMSKVNETTVRGALNKMGDVFVEKNVNYGNSFETSLDKYGIIAALTRISDKFNRFENLILKNKVGTADESVVDTLLDMATYCVMTAVYIENGGVSDGKNHEG